MSHTHKNTGRIPSDFKRLRRQRRRTQEKQALREGREPPLFRTCNARDWF